MGTAVNTQRRASSADVEQLLVDSELLLMDCPAAGHIGRARLVISNRYLAWKENQNTFLKVIGSKTIEEFSTRL